jgi:hypothetical protein
MCKKILLKLFLAAFPLMTHAVTPENAIRSNCIQSDMKVLDASCGRCCDRGPRGPDGLRGSPGATGATGATGPVVAVNFIYATAEELVNVPANTLVPFSVTNSSNNFTLNPDGSITYIAAISHTFNIQVNLYSANQGTDFTIRINGNVAPGGTKPAASPTQFFVSGQITAILNQNDVISVTPLESILLVPDAGITASITISQID